MSCLRQEEGIHGGIRHGSMTTEGPQSSGQDKHMNTHEEPCEEQELRGARELKGVRAHGRGRVGNFTLTSKDQLVG